jgi:hypothetical protein
VILWFVLRAIVWTRVTSGNLNRGRGGLFYVYCTQLLRVSAYILAVFRSYNFDRGVQRMWRHQKYSTNLELETVRICVKTVRNKKIIPASSRSVAGPSGCTLSVREQSSKESVGIP